MARVQAKIDENHDTIARYQSVLVERSGSASSKEPAAAAALLEKSSAASQASASKASASAAHTLFLKRRAEVRVSHAHLICVNCVSRCARERIGPRPCTARTTASLVAHRRCGDFSMQSESVLRVLRETQSMPTVRAKLRHLQEAIRAAQTGHADPFAVQVSAAFVRESGSCCRPLLRRISMLSALFRAL